MPSHQGALCPVSVTVSFAPARIAGNCSPSSTKMIPLSANWMVSHTERSEEHTSELQSLMSNSYAVFCLKKKNQTHYKQTEQTNSHNNSNYYTHYTSKFYTQ